MPHASDVVSPDDELKVYRCEGEDEELSSAENLKEVKSSLVTEVAEAEEKNRKNASSFLPITKTPRLTEETIGPLLHGKPFQYLPPSQYGYVVSPYHPHTNGHYGTIPMVNRVPLMPTNHPPSPLPFMMYKTDPFQPPPAHMGISHKAGIGKTPMYPLASNSHFHSPVFSPDFQQFSWHPMYTMAPSFRSSPYPHLPPPSNLQGKFPLLHSAPVGVPTFMGAGSKVEMPESSQDSRSFPNFSPSHHQQSSNANSESTQRSHSDKKKSHIKKPLNAFMLFMREQRPHVVQTCTLKESAAINRILGKKWHDLPRDEQAKYYDLAKHERELHMQKYPGWTARDNYACNAKKKKRRRDKSQDGDGNSPKKCRARFGLDQMESWCKPCKRKKKCIRYRSNGGGCDEDIGSVESLEAVTPDSTDMNQQSSDFSLSSPISVPRPGESVQSTLNGDHVQQLSTGGEGDLAHVALPTPPSTDSSTAT